MTTTSVAARRRFGVLHDFGRLPRVMRLLLLTQLAFNIGFYMVLFVVFTVITSRRLKSDRFFTNDYSPEVYTPEGIDWVENTTMSDLVLRHHPELAPALEGVENGFAPWNRLDA
jgi:hypothetical protein